MSKDYTVPQEWVESVNYTAQRTAAILAALEADVAALVAHLDLKFETLPAIPAKRVLVPRT